MTQMTQYDRNVSPMQRFAQGRHVGRGQIQHIQHAFGPVAENAMRANTVLGGSASMIQPGRRLIRIVKLAHGVPLLD